MPHIDELRQQESRGTSGNAQTKTPATYSRDDVGDGERKRTNKEEGFYKSKEWRKARRLALQRDGYLCQLQYEGCERIASTVHHIKALEEWPELALNLDNLTSCCARCHEQTKCRKSGASEVPAPPGVRVIKL